MTTLYDIPIKSISGKSTTLAPYKGQVLLIVNVASRCGFTKQYKPLQALYEKYHKKGFSVLGFPCNQFLNQEPEESEHIQQFATSCFRVSFPLFEKIIVKGAKQAPLYQYLQSHMQKKPLWFIPWNFTKILVDTNGQVIQQFSPLTPLKHIEKKIAKLLK